MQQAKPTWGRDASTKRVRVTYRVRTRDEAQRATTTRTMSHNEYWDFAMSAFEKGYELVRAEQILEDK